MMEISNHGASPLMGLFANKPQNTGVNQGHKYNITPIKAQKASAPSGRPMGPYLIKGNAVNWAETSQSKAPSAAETDHNQLIATSNTNRNFNVNAGGSVDLPRTQADFKGIASGVVGELENAFEIATEKVDKWLKTADKRVQNYIERGYDQEYVDRFYQRQLSTMDNFFKAEVMSNAPTFTTNFYQVGGEDSIFKPIEGSSVTYELADNFVLKPRIADYAFNMGRDGTITTIDKDTAQSLVGDDNEFWWMEGGDDRYVTFD